MIRQLRIKGKTNIKIHLFERWCKPTEILDADVFKVTVMKDMDSNTIFQFNPESKAWEPMSELEALIFEKENIEGPRIITELND